MLDGSSVELTPFEMLRRVEAWVDDYPAERAFVSAALAETAGRVAGDSLDLVTETWSSIGEPSPRVWLIDGWLPLGVVALLTGEGGAGKSRLALQLSAALAAERGDPHRWIDGAAAPAIGAGAPAGGVPVVYASWEDRPDEIARRLSEISGGPAPWCEPGVLDNLRILDLAGRGPLWCSSGRYDMPDLSPLGQAVRRVAVDCQARLLVLDSLAAVYGANENDRSQVRGFMSSWDAWASAVGCAVLLIGHPPKSAAGYSGSTDWHAAARARWELARRPLQSGPRSARADPLCWQLALVKSNYGPEPEPLRLDWDPSGPRWAVSGTWPATGVDSDEPLLASINGHGRDARYDDI